MSQGQILRRGPPSTFSQQDRVVFAELIRQHGIHGAQRLAHLSISRATLCKITGESGIKL